MSPMVIRHRLGTISRRILAAALNGLHTDARLSRANLEQSIKVDLLPKSQSEHNTTMRQQISRTFTSDTFTAPSPGMLAYASQASLGDDVYGVDTATNALEQHMAKLTGKQGAIFMPSGTMSNQIAMRTHLQQPPYTVVLDSRAHIYAHEAGGLASNSGAQAIPISPLNKHHLTLEDIQENVILSEDAHFAPTRIIALENTLSGTLFPQDEIKRISSWARDNNIIMHMDGARIWHVACETGLSIKELCDPFESASLCFSKGLGAPMGSILVGSNDFVRKARHFRKMFGGGLRQTGYAAASAGYALNDNYPLLAGTHKLAKRVEQGLRDIGADILVGAETNMVFYDLTRQGVQYPEIKTKLANLPEPIYQNGSRVVIHYQVSSEAVETFLETLGQLVNEKRAAGFVAGDYSAPAKVNSTYGKN